MYDRLTLLAVLLALVACGPEAPLPSPPTFVPPPPATTEPPAETTKRALAVDIDATWLTLVASDGARRAEPQLAVVAGTVHVDADRITRVEVQLADIHIPAELLPPRGLDIVDPRLDFLPTEPGRAALDIQWSVLDGRGAPRAIRPIELEGVGFDAVLREDVSIDGASPGVVWRLDGLFELSDLAFSIVAR